MTGSFEGANAKKDGSADVRFRFPFSEIANYANLLNALNSPLKSVLEVEGTKTKLGSVQVKQIKVDKDGEAVITLVGDAEVITNLNVSQLVQKSIILRIKKED